MKYLGILTILSFFVAANATAKDFEEKVARGLIDCYEATGTLPKSVDETGYCGEVEDLKKDSIWNRQSVTEYLQIVNTRSEKDGDLYRFQASVRFVTQKEKNQCRFEMAGEADNDSVSISLLSPVQCIGPLAMTELPSSLMQNLSFIELLKSSIESSKELKLKPNENLNLKLKVVEFGAFYVDYSVSLVNSSERNCGFEFRYHLARKKLMNIQAFSCQ